MTPSKSSNFPIVSLHINSFYEREGLLVYSRLMVFLAASKASIYDHFIRKTGLNSTQPAFLYEKTEHLADCLKELSTDDVNTQK